MRFVPAPLPFRLDRRLALVGLLFVAALMLAACSGGGDDEDDGAEGGSGGGDAVAGLGNDLEDACLIFTAEDGALALDAEVDLITEPEFEYPESFLECRYQERDGRRKAGILVQRGQTLDGFRSDVERTEAFTSPEEIRGVADEAFWITGGLNTLMLRDGDLTVTVQIGFSQLFGNDADLAALREKNIEVGRIIIQRLRGEVLVANAATATPAASATRPPGATPAASSTASATATAAPTPEPTAIPTEPLDRAGDSFEDNLLARVADGDWTLGEGLVETLALFAGERDTTEVLSTPDLAFAEATAIYAMAQEYLENGSDASALAEVERLLDLLIFTGEELDAMVLGATTANRGSDRAGATTLISNMAATTVENCRQMYSAFADVIADRAPEQCLNVAVMTVGPSTFHIYVPALEDPATGWEDRHTALVRATINETVEQTFLRLGKLPLDVRIVLSAQAHPRVLAAAIQPPTGSSCIVTIFTQSQGLADGNFKQSLAHEFGHCFQDVMFAGQRVDADARVWREEGFAEYLSDVAYPFNDYERRIVGPFSRAEVQTTTVRSRSYHNYMWFSFWSDSLGGDLELIELLRSGPTAGGTSGTEALISEQEDFLAATPGFASTHHQFAEAMSDGAVSNRSGGSWAPGGSLNDTVRLRSPQHHAISADFQPFGVAKWEFVIPRGSTVTTRVIEDAGVTATWRDVDEPGGWLDLNPIERFVASCDEDFHGYLVLSSIEEPAVFALDVVEIEDDDCEEEPDLPEIVGHDACLVGTWAVDMSGFRASIEENMVGDLNLTSVSGDVFVTFLQNGDIESEISGLTVELSAPWEGVANRLKVTMRWDGTGGGSWNADGSLIQIVTNSTGVSLMQIAKVDDGPPVGDVNLFDDDLFGTSIAARANGYQCTEDTLQIDDVTIAGGEQAAWRRQ